MFLKQFRKTVRCIPSFVFIIATFAGAGWALGEDSAGQKIYKDQCASCHGENGTGTDEYSESLIGDRSVNELSALIERTMPEGEAEICVGTDARAVAEWIHSAFYSPAAQARLRPARREPARLTADQYRHAVADVFQRFRSSGNVPDKHGLSARYYASRQFKSKELKIERTDATVDFDFGTKSPDKEKIKPEEFSIQWQGSLLAPDSGVYEIIVRSENGFNLWINEDDDDKKLIDAWVLGPQNEHRTTLPLLGGRSYFLRLNWFKYKDPAASVSLSWKRPHHAEEVIPARYLFQPGARQTYVVHPPFPPPDRSYGYERATSVSKAWDAATTSGALEIVDHVITHRRDYRKLEFDKPDGVKKFCQDVAEYAFRRPLTEAQKSLYIDRQFQDAPDVETAFKRSILLIFKSPRFQFREPQDSADPYDIAARISFNLWDSIPDARLLTAARKNQLRNRKQVRAHVARMANDIRAQQKLAVFFQHWMRMDHVDDLSRDSSLFPEFNAQIESDLRESLKLGIRDLVSNPNANLRDVFLSSQTYFNERLANFYRQKEIAGNEFVKVEFEPDKRAGILSHPFLMTGFAYHNTSSPIHRGVFLSRNVLGRYLKPPQEAVTPDPPDLKPELTTRERVAAQTSPQNCATCHRMINALGFVFENFDAVGRYRAQEKEKVIDATGSYISKTGKRSDFTGPREIAEFLAQSPDVQSAFAEQLFHNMVNQPVLAWGADTPGRLATLFAAADLNIRELLVEVVTEAAIADNMK